MEKVPKIVTERLQAAAVTTAHPDADVLAAFSEHALQERERSRVVEHLARCSECREVVALALPPVEEALPVAAKPVRNVWLTWPRMRWALVAAGVVTVASVSLLQFGRHLSEQKMARLYDATPTAMQRQAEKKSASVPAAPDANQEAKKAAVPADLSASRRESENESKKFDRLERFNSVLVSKDKNVVGGTLGGPIRAGVLHGQQLAHGPKMSNQFQQNNWNANASNNYAFQQQSQSPAVASPPAFGNQQAANQLVMLPSGATQPSPSPAATPAKVPNQKQDLDSLAVAGRSVAPLQAQSGSAGAEIARAKPATSANAPQSADAAGYALNVEGSNFSPSGTLAPESAQWSINSTGGLQRSMDQGRTWEDVDVNAGRGQGADMGLAMAMKSRDKTPPRTAKSNADIKEKRIVFRAVSANGPDVWAGGSEGSLYHSIDSGTHWMRVVPSWRGIDLTSDIINLQFSDPQHGRIVTSSAEIWLTGDAGQTWDKH